MPKHIEFIGPAMPVEASRDVIYAAKVDGKRITVRIQMEALEDAARSQGDVPSLDLFERNKDKFLSVAMRKIQSGKMEDGIVWIRTWPPS